ncbi:hypothetical protein [uncultured Nocardioides sp.]|uniref:hypothetical protein n=1 Tax=uncultured Nocardioides sp. TaxID=198441 RepID=UPI002605FA6B|nr:hypothetical protein [uncultured Nocardioides sp.]
MDLDVASTLSTSGPETVPGGGSVTPSRVSPRWTSRIPVAVNDVTEVAQRLDAAARQVGLSGTDFGAVLGVSAARFRGFLDGGLETPAHLLLRAERVSAGLRRAKDSGRVTALDVCDFVGPSIRHRAVGAAVNFCAVGLTDLLQCQEQDPTALPAWEAIPSPTGFLEWDVLIATMVGQVFRFQHRDPPEWAVRRARRLKTPRVILTDGYTPDDVKRLTPRWLSAYGVFVSSDSLGMLSRDALDLPAGP